MFRIAALAAVLLFSTQVYAQTSQNGPNQSQGVTSGPAAGSPATMTSPQAGPVATKHQRQVLRKPSQSMQDKIDHSGAAGSSAPTYPPTSR